MSSTKKDSKKSGTLNNVNRNTKTSDCGCGCGCIPPIEKK